MASPLLLRTLTPFLRLRLHHHHRLVAGVYTRRPWYNSAAEPRRPEEEAAVTVKEGGLARPLRRCEDPDYRKWRGKEEEILEDIRPLTILVKDILHSDSLNKILDIINLYDLIQTIGERSRYMNGERLTIADETFVLEKLLAYHPHSEDKIGCGFDSIMVDRHPQFRQSRCLFVIRTDGGWIDFSYQKCIREYIKHKYPSHAEKFIKEHFKRGSG